MGNDDAAVIERAEVELRRRAAETLRQLRFAEHTQQPNPVHLRTLGGKHANLLTKLNLLTALRREIRALETTVSFKMMTRYPENQPYRIEYRRELHRLRRQLRQLADRYQPVEGKKFLVTRP